MSNNLNIQPLGNRVLVLPVEPRLTPALARKVRELVAAGATVAGPKPAGSRTVMPPPRPPTGKFSGCVARASGRARSLTSATWVNPGAPAWT